MSEVTSQQMKTIGINEAKFEKFVTDNVKKQLRLDAKRGKMIDDVHKSMVEASVRSTCEMYRHHFREWVSA